MGFFFPFPFNPGKHSTDQTVKGDQSVESNTTKLNTNAAPAEQASELAGSRSPPHFHFRGAQRTSGFFGVIKQSAGFTWLPTNSRYFTEDG